MEWVEAMIEAGRAVLPDPDSTPYRVAMSLLDLQEIIADFWRP